MHKVEFDNGRKLRTTREHIELEETTDVFAIPTRARKILEVASVLSKKDFQVILNLEVLTPLQQVWIW